MHCNHCCMQKAHGKLIGPATTVLRYPLVATSLPKLLPFAGIGFKVEGELYSIPAKRLWVLDTLECHPHWYRRMPLTVTSHGEVHNAEAYFMTSRFIHPNWQEDEFLPKF